MDIIQFIMVNTVEEIIKLKKDTTKEIYSKTFDSFETAEENEQEAKSKADFINSFGLPWWKCPATGKSCTTDCYSFVKASVYQTDTRKDQKSYKFSGFRCDVY